MLLQGRKVTRSGAALSLYAALKSQAALKKAVVPCRQHAGHWCSAVAFLVYQHMRVQRT